MRVLVLGVSGMLGSTVFRYLEKRGVHDVWGTVRNPSSKKFFPEDTRERIIDGVDVLDNDSLVALLAKVKPKVIINCVGLIKQLATSKDPLCALPINAMLPHRLAKLCELTEARLIHISTDCVFSGKKGNYKEDESCDAGDLYGVSKFIGELHSHPCSVTLRTSIIGHELTSSYALIDWFLSQSGKVKGYSKAIFSGLPTVELAEVIHDFVLPNPSLFGLYHVSSEPISKLALLRIVSEVYALGTELVPDNSVVIDRSLDSTKFSIKTGYKSPDWRALVRKMHEFKAIY